MSKSAFRGSVTGVVLFAALTSTAAAAPTLLRPQALIDVSKDGQYVLLSDGSVTAATGRGVLAINTRQPIDLASERPIALYKDVGNGILVVASEATPRGTVESIGPDGIAVPAATGQLVNDGATLIFSTTERPARIIKRDLATKTSTVLLSGSALLDASEDGKVVTWQRQLPVPVRPEGSAPGDFGFSSSGVAVGYLVEGTQPRVVRATRWARHLTSEPLPGCPTNFSVGRTTPTGLQISERLGGTGVYSLVLSTAFTRIGTPFTETVYSRLTATGGSVLASSNGGTEWVTVSTDPASGAWTSIVTGQTPEVGGTVHQDNGASYALSVPLPETRAVYLNAIPYRGGAGVAFTALPSGTGTTGTYLDTHAEAGSPLDDTTPWTTLPRSVDAVDGPGTTVDTSSLDCDLVVAGAPADYAAITPKSTGNSAGVIAVHTAPPGKIAARSVTATVAWFGIRLWTRTATTDTTVALPSIPVGFPGFKATTKIRLTDGTVLSGSAALRRTR